jgi:hypothetical protein
LLYFNDFPITATINDPTKKTGKNTTFAKSVSVGYCVIYDPTPYTTDNNAANKLK